MVREHTGGPWASTTVRASARTLHYMAVIAKVTDQPVNVRLPRELHEAVLTRAAEDDRTMAQTIRVALRYYLQNTTPIAAP
jgi:hypothetical protein